MGRSRLGFRAMASILSAPQLRFLIIAKTFLKAGPPHAKNRHFGQFSPRYSAATRSIATISAFRSGVG